MLNSIIRFSIHNKLIIGLFTLALIGVGSWSLTKLPIDAVPDITNNQVQVITVSPAYAASDIERLVTFPLEQSMSTIPGIEEIRSISRFGLSVVTIVFNDDVEIYWARQQINERLLAIKSVIPEKVGTPQLAPVTTGLGEIYQYVIRPQPGYEHMYSEIELRTIQDWIVRRQLLGTNGVADVSSFGGKLKQWEIEIVPDKLRSFNLTIPELVQCLEKNNQNAGGAYLDKNPEVYFIRTEGLFETKQDIENVVVRTLQGGNSLTIKDVGNVKEGFAPRYGALTWDDKGEVVGGIVMMLKGENSSKVIADVKNKVEIIKKSLPKGLTIEAYLDRTHLVNKAIKTVVTNLFEGALIVIFVLVLFLGNVRAGIVVASVIPLALLFAISLMNLFGVSGNLMSLGALDFGLIVDGAVIIVEATLHYFVVKGILKPNQEERNSLVYESASKIRNAAAFGEIIILIVYLPILALGGVEGKMFSPMAKTVGFAIVGAFILSLTYVPMMSSWILKHETNRLSRFSDGMMLWLEHRYLPILKFVIRKSKLVMISAVVLLSITIPAFMLMGGEFIPTLEEGDFAVETRLLPGSSINRTIDVTLQAAKILQDSFPEVKKVVGKIGTSEIPTDPMPMEACDLMIILKDKEEWVSATSREELAANMSEKLSVIPGVNFSFQQPIQMRFNELMTGVRQDVAIKIFGENLDTLSRLAEQMGPLISKVEGLQDLYIEQTMGLPQLVIRYDRQKLKDYGISISDANEVIASSYAGVSAGWMFDQEKRFEVVLRVPENVRMNLDQLKNLTVRNSNGVLVPLYEIASLDKITGANQIQREQAKRRIVVAFNVRERDVESVVTEIQSLLDKKMKLPSGYYLEYGGQFENLKAASSRLMIAVPIALLLILILLYMTFHSMRSAIIIFSAVPLSAIGGVSALYLRDMPFSISAGVGFIALFGVAVLNGIVLIAEFNKQFEYGARNMNKVILSGAIVRLRPVLMTATVASLGFLPMAISNGAGGEVQKPLATVVIGGLLTSTILTLLVLPVLYKSFSKSDIK